VASVHLATTLADIDADARAGLRTSGVALGTRRGLLLSMLLMGAAALCSWPLRNMPAFTASLLSLPLFLVPMREPRWKAGGPNVLLPAKGATLIFSAAAGFIFPAYIPALAAAIVLTRLYYRKRFDVSYPSFR
jgi:4-hydroxybenzoate polyprenyltransferase